jgi:hypothetical protein
MGDELVELQLFVQIVVYKFWNAIAAFITTKCGSLKVILLAYLNLSAYFPGASSNKLERTSRDFLSGTSDTNNTRDTPPFVSSFQCLTHHIDIT